MSEIDRAFHDMVEGQESLSEEGWKEYCKFYAELWEDLKIADEWLDRCESPAERAFLEAAIKEFRLVPEDGALVGDVHLTMQVDIERYRVDFLINDKNVVEVDGHAYHSSSAQVRRDAERDAVLRSKGFRLLRLTAHRIFSAPEAAMADVKDYLRHSA